MQRTKDLKGQTLIELVIVISIVIIVVGALTFATIASLRNAQAARLQAQATKYAQEGLERVRSGRDRNNPITGNFQLSGASISDWQDPDLWSNQISTNCTPVCYFKLSSGSGGSLQHIGTSDSQAEVISNIFKRVIILSDSSATCSTGVSCYTVEKIVNVKVSWSDFSGNHESKLTTILRKI